MWRSDLYIWENGWEKPISIIYSFCERYIVDTATGIAKVWRYEVKLPRKNPDEEEYVAQDSLSVFKPTKALGKKVYICLKEEPIMADVTDGETIQTYYGKQGYGVTMDYSWENAIKLLAAVKQEYKDK